MANSCGRILPGILILVLVCILWVFSAEVASVLIKDETDEHGSTQKNSQAAANNNKKTGAYFLTYFKSALFSLYLWIVLTFHLFKSGCQGFGFGHEENMLELSESHYVPIKNADNQYDYDMMDAEDIYSTTGDEKLDSSGNSSNSSKSDGKSPKSVRFKSHAEVRHLVRCDSKTNKTRPIQASAVVSCKNKTRNGLKEHAYLAIQCVTLWFFANYFYALALRFTEPGMTNILSLTSSVFILFFGVFLPSSPSDRLTLTKLVAVSLMICGAVMAGVADSSLEATPLGLAFSLASAFLYAAYLTLIQRRCPNQSTTGVLSLLGFMGLYCLVFFWPAFIVLHVLGIETFQIPTDYNVLILLTTSSLVGSVIADALWLIGAYMTSSLTATISLSLTIPMAMLADWLIRSVHIDLLEILAILPIVLGFSLVALSSQWEHWDPVWNMIKQCYGPCRGTKARWLLQKTRFWFSRSKPTEEQQSCSLLSAMDDNDSAAISS